MTLGAWLAPLIAMPSRPSDPRVSGTIASGAGFARHPDSARRERKIGRCPYNPAGSEWRNWVPPHCTRRIATAAEQALKKLAQATGQSFCCGVEGLRDRQVVKPQGKLLEHIVELLSSGRRIRC